MNKLHVKQDAAITPIYASREMTTTISKYMLSEKGTTPRVAYRLVHDELMLDGDAKLNLATFVTTWMEGEAKMLMAETFEKNMIDKDEYPQTAELENRCVNILANLWHAPRTGNATGTSTVGSSEACMLGGMALKWRWRERMKKLGKPTDKPNMVCRYWDIEPRHVPMEKGRYHLTGEEAVKLCDENTIGVVAILGSTFDGSYEPVEEISDALDKFEKKTGIDIPIHVDGASGGFIAPFVQPKLVWDFKLPRVKSINTSGHKYGLVYPGLGWVVWRTEEDLPKELIFNVNYLGGQMPTFAINFSRPGNQVIAQYYNFIRLGRDGYTKIQKASSQTAQYLAEKISKLGPFKLITKGDEAPVFAFTLKDDVKHFTVFDLSERLRERGWQLPAYTFPKNLENLAVLRVVVKENFSHDLADLLIEDIKRHLEWFEKHPPSQIGENKASFHH
jgi:glutamate decarboxylase